MNFKIAIGLVTICAVAAVSPAVAKTKLAKATGVRCVQGSDAIIVGASRFKPEIRNRLRVGQKVNISIPTIGPLNCTVY